MYLSCLLLAFLPLALGGSPQEHFGDSSRTSPLAACAPLPPRASPPESVHDLRIDDIKVIAALGDSITAGLGAKGIVRGDPPSIENIMEDRGVSFSMGGDPDALTLPNLIQYYRQDLVGASMGSHLTEICYGPWCPPFQYRPSDNMNAAQSGAMASNLEYELTYLITRLRTEQAVDFENDFKLITIFIGNNDACFGCEPFSGHTYLSPELFEMAIRALLEKIHLNVPRAVVNLMMGFNVSQVWDLTHDDPYCSKLRNSGLVFECTCAFLSPILRTLMDTIIQSYNERLASIAKSYQDRQDPGFAVIVDPLLKNVRIQDWTLEHLSNVDCFHPTVQAHEVLAKGVWHNLFRSSEDKLNAVAPDEDIPIWCPTNESRIMMT
ncbi:hypothetical protein SpCBS45565_g00917 [Spizellomyces sp. 'palustris']|nr:hypothetical protein SpCBS45565_g00917 [Spizellomyces sp. 'palustris']